MEREKSAMFLGLGLLIAGIVILMFLLVTVIGLAANPGPFMDRQLGGSTQNKAPSASFGWSSQGNNVTFADLSTSGNTPITSRAWNLGDSTTSTDRNPTHTYATNGSYTVTLTVRDQNNLESSTATNVNLRSGGNNNGMSQSGPNVNFDIGNVLLPVAIALLTFGLYVVGFLVGGSLVKAGWNLIRPRPETIRIRLKPRNFESGATAEVVAPPPPMILPPSAPLAPPTAAPSSALPPPPSA